MRPPPVSNLLLERDSELELVNDTLTKAAAGSGGVLLFEGSPGVGKTRLLQEGADAALSMGMSVRTARGAEAPAAAPFRTAIELFGRDVESSLLDNGELVSGSAGLALPLFVSGGSAPTPASEASLLEGLFRLSANLAEREPLVLVVDEANWVDDRSLAFFLYLADRLSELSIALLVAARRPRASFPQALREFVLHRATRSVVVAELSPAATSEVVRRSGFSDADDVFCATCYEETRGNPFYLTQLLDELKRERPVPSIEAIPRIRRLGPAGIAASINARLEAVGREAGEIARAAAVLQEDASLGHVCRLADLSLERVTAEASRLVAAGILAPTEPLVFVHPIVRSSIVGVLSRDDLSRLHARAAAVLSTGGAAPDRIAPHVVASEPGTHSRAVPILSEAAEIAAERGAIATEVALLRRLLGEDLASKERARVLAKLGVAESLLGDPLAPDRLHSALDLVDDLPERASIYLQMGHALVRGDRRPEAAEVFKKALDELDSQHSDLRDEVEVGFVFAALILPDHQVEAKQRADRLLARIGSQPTPAQRALLVIAGMARATEWDGREASVELARRGFGDGELLRHESSDGPSFSLLTGIFLSADELDDTIRVATMGLEDAQARGSLTGFATASYVRSNPLIFAGRIPEAIADAEQAVAVGRYAPVQFWTAAVSRLAIAQTEHGDLDAAERTLAAVEDGTTKILLELGVYLEARGYLRLAQKRTREALEDLLESNRILASNPFTDKPGFPNGRAVTAEVLLTFGRPDDALDLIESELERARRWGAPRAIGMSLRALGTVVGGAKGIEYLRESVEVLGRSPSQLELVRAQVRLGSALADQGEGPEARAILSSALDAAQSMQARLIADEALTQLVKAGGRPRRLRATGVSSLTPAELRVARMAAQGLANREMAERLFVTIKAIERHVASVYAKLAVTSRADLITRFGEQLTTDHI